MPVIETKNLTKSFAGKTVLSNFNISVNITAVSGDEIRRLNRETRNTDKVTDVLSFPMLEYSEPCLLKEKLMPWDFDPEDESVFVGDIVLCKDKISEQAEEYGHGLVREVGFLTAHSMLHLLGYDHVDDPEGERIMREKEELVLQKLGITRD